MLQRVAAFCFARSPLLELARVLVRFGHVARLIVNANQMGALTTSNKPYTFQEPVFASRVLRARLFM